jgi:hypothetical protein
MIVKSCVPAEGLGDGRETAADKVSAAEEGAPRGHAYARNSNS